MKTTHQFAVFATQVEPKYKVEQNGVYQNEALSWLRESLDPSPLMAVKGMRIWNSYKAKYGTEKLKQRGLYGVLRKLLKESKYQNHEVSFKRHVEGMIVINAVANINLEKIEITEEFQTNIENK
uniref:Uncharacterized protein n=1 Tax=Zygnema circumcarinatum TaxID=35869 RepID=Q32RI7_ZYGCR|nr:hypothetical protein P8547_pgp031 [Zygnema circumcarinatum]AAX45892.1 hypothetical protein [Zygnema circumcarinatum]